MELNEYMNQDIFNPKYLFHGTAHKIEKLELKLDSLNNPHNEKIIIPEQLLGLYEDTIQELEGGILEDQGVLNIISEVKNNNGNPEQSLNIIKLLKYIYTERNPNSIEDIEDSGSLSSYLFTNGIEATSVDVEQLAKDPEIKRKNPISKNNSNNDYGYLEKELSMYFDSKVKINGKKIEISFVNDKDLDRILEMLNIKG